MKLVLLEIGKSREKAIQELVSEYAKRIKRFHPFDIQKVREARLSKGAKSEDICQIEAENLSKAITPTDLIVLLAERGKQMTSREFAVFLQKQLLMPKSRMVFIIGGAFGFDESIYERADHKISLSQMTFSHQLIRPIFMEQLYRAFTIINRHPYHND